MSLAPAAALASDAYSVRPGRTAFAISPDGQTVVIAAARGDVKQLWVRPLAARQPRRWRGRKMRPARSSRQMAPRSASGLAGR